MGLYLKFRLLERKDLFWKSNFGKRISSLHRGYVLYILKHRGYVYSKHSSTHYLIDIIHFIFQIRQLRLAEDFLLYSQN